MKLCKYCNKYYPESEFHHRNKKKEFSIGMAFYNQYSFKRIKEEIEKCNVICANCHRILHYQERNNKKYNIGA